jgi:hypothetical protein
VHFYGYRISFYKATANTLSEELIESESDLTTLKLEDKYLKKEALIFKAHSLKQVYTYEEYLDVVYSLKIKSNRDGNVLIMSASGHRFMVIHKDKKEEEAQGTAGNLPMSIWNTVKNSVNPNGDLNSENLPQKYTQDGVEYKSPS